ncbi:MAG: large subunit ribosomal protein [Acidobacteriaceae bacterium]|jgi:large subunit ribosomal protein L10|nr:large subunit ribosomal protein [Acidobacteriaceae bacterium]
MALTRAKKAEKVTELAAELESSTSAIVGTFAKLTVAQDYNLRRVVREAGGKYRVLKNKLAARAAKGTQVEAALQGLKGVSSVAYTAGDPVALTKAISTWVTDNAEFTFKLGIVDGKVISIEEIKQLATMPGRDELFSKLLFLINAPAQRLATVIAATGRDLAVVVNQAVEQNKFAGPAVAPAEAEAVPAAEASALAATPETTPEASAVAGEPSAVQEGAAPDVTGATQADPAQPETGEASQAESASTEAPAEG